MNKTVSGVKYDRNRHRHQRGHQHQQQVAKAKRRYSRSGEIFFLEDFFKHQKKLN